VRHRFDHKDFLWCPRHAGTPRQFECTRNGTTQIGAGSLGNPGSAWHVKGSGNFFGNGASDILWQNDSGEAYTGR
jgi:hypothetical protein